MSRNFITLKNCRIEDSKSVKLENINWTFNTGEAWLVIGANGSGKANFLKALAGELKIIPDSKFADSLYSNFFEQNIEIVSLEKAASLIEEERQNDESEFVEGGVDIGRTGRIFLAEAICKRKLKRGEPLPDEALRLETFPQIKLCGIEKILDRGLKYMSTGEIRRSQPLLFYQSQSALKLIFKSEDF